MKNLEQHTKGVVNVTEGRSVTHFKYRMQAFLVNTNTIKKNYFLFPKNKRGGYEKVVFLALEGLSWGLHLSVKL